MLQLLMELEPLTLGTEADAVAEGDGDISLTVAADPADPDTYLDFPEEKATVSVIDNDDATLPSITISADPTSVTEGPSAQAVFKLASAVGSDTSITRIDDVKVQITQVGNYIDTTDVTTHDVDITAVGTDATLAINIVDDNIDEEPGIVLARLLTDLDGTQSWSVGATERATVAVSSEAGDIPNFEYCCRFG